MLIALFFLRNWPIESRFAILSSSFVLSEERNFLVPFAIGHTAHEPKKSQKLLPGFSTLLVDYRLDTLHLSNRNYIQYTPAETLRTFPAAFLGSTFTVHTYRTHHILFTPLEKPRLFPLPIIGLDRSTWSPEHQLAPVTHPVCAFFGGSIAKAGPGGRKSFQGGAKRRGSSYLLSTYSCFGILFPFGMIYDRRIHIQDEYS